MTAPPIAAVRPRVAVPCGCRLGEGVIWDHRTGTLHWVDIHAGLLFSWRPEGGAPPDIRRLGEPVGFAVLTPDPQALIVGLASGLARLDLGSGALAHLLRPEPDLPGNRLNDGNVGADGVLWFGSEDDREVEETGAFYRWSAAGLSRFGPRATVTNGPLADPGRGIVYTAETSAGRVNRHRLDAAGAPGPAEPFVVFGPGDGHPDGLTLDAADHLWVCHFGAGRVTRFTPEGEPALVLPIPTGQPTKVAFGGPDLATLYITTAARDLDREVDPFAGHLLAVELGIRGRPATPCTVAG